MSKIEIIRRFDEILNKELTDLLQEQDAIAARRRQFMESESVQEHLEKHKGDASLVFSFEMKGDEKKKGGIESITEEESWRIDTKAKNKEEAKAFVGYEGKSGQQTQQGFSGYSANKDSDSKFGGYMAGAGGREELASASYQQGKDTAWCSDCGCGFNRSGSGEVVQDPAIPGHEASAAASKGYGNIGKSSATGQGYTTGSSSKATYGMGPASSSKASYGH